MVIYNFWKGGSMSSQKSKPDYKKKAEAISKGYTEFERKLSLQIWQKNQVINALTDEYYENGVIVEIEEKIKHLNSSLEHYNTFMQDDLFAEAKKVNHASYERRNRLSQRIESMIKKGSCIFLTLTFNDNVLASTNEDTRKKYVQRFLKASSSQYVANIDYGKKNEREHYHAVVLADKVDYKLWHDITHSDSAINFERIRNTSDNVKLAKYVCKLTNHAVKETTKRCHTIYSRN